jgi:tight adherence protein B
MTAIWLCGLSVAALITMSARHPPGGRLAWLREPPPDGARPTATALAAAVVAIGGLLMAMQVSLALVVVIVAAVVVVDRLRRTRRLTKAAEDRRAATVEATFALAGELRAGRTTAEALAAVAGGAGPLEPGFAAAARAVQAGGDAFEELGRLAELPGAERLRSVVAAWSVAAAAGGRVAVVLERLSDAMDSEDELRRELDAALAGPRATMALLAMLPVLGLGLGQAVGARPLQLLLHRPLGWLLLGGATILDVGGVVATKAIARTALRT